MRYLQENQGYSFGMVNSHAFRLSYLVDLMVANDLTEKT